MLQRILLSVQLLVLLVCCIYPCQGQKPAGLVSLSLVARVGDNPLLLNDTLHLLQGPVVVTTFRFYLSQVVLYHHGKPVWQEKDSYHLLDLEKPASWSWNLAVSPNIKFDSLSFLVGIDSATHTLGAMDGDLDPTLGMYWAWQSGYIQVKLEGWSPLVPVPGHAFQLHLGGYQGAHAVARAVGFRVSDSPAIAIRLDLGKFLNQMDLQRVHHIMSPGALAASLSTQFADWFYNEE